MIQYSETNNTISHYYQNSSEINETIDRFNNYYNSSDDGIHVNHTNENQIDLEELLEVPWYTTAIFVFLFSTLSVIAVSGNSLITYTILKYKRMRNVTNYFICNLAIADIVIGLFSIPFQVNIFLL